MNSEEYNALASWKHFPKNPLDLFGSLTDKYVNGVSDDIEKWEKERQELNNELIVPAYRRFCKEFNLPFHFWDELPEGSHNAKISLAENTLHREAMNLFNRLKPQFVIFKDRIVTFRFEDWAGDFKYKTWSIDNFLDETSNKFYSSSQTIGLLSHCNERYSMWLGLLLIPLVGVLIAFFSSLFHSLAIAWLFIAIAVISSVFLVKRFMLKKEEMLCDHRFDDGLNQLNKLRAQLAEHNDHLANDEKKNDPEKFGVNNISALGRTLLKAQESTAVVRIVERIKNNLDYPPSQLS